MANITFQDQVVFHARAEKIFAEEYALLKPLMPWADIQHIGSTSIPGATTKGDIDIVVRVLKEDFLKTRDILKGIYETHQLDNWSETFASFKDDNRALPLGIQLTIMDCEDDVFVTFRDILRSSPEMLSEYNALKISCQNQDTEIYIAKKAEFFEQLIQSKKLTSSSS